MKQHKSNLIYNSHQGNYYPAVWYEMMKFLNLLFDEINT